MTTVALENRDRKYTSKVNFDETFLKRRMSELVMGRLIGIGIEHLQNRAFDRESESESHRKKLSLKFDSNTSILFQFSSK